jgi:AcrR family transcriptional regulator
MADEKRPYRMKRRAELEQLTRQRITESAVELHGTVGPSRTSISAVAERAGVRRSTVYRHFPDEEALFDACSSHWANENPVPELARWAAIEDPDKRLREGLGELYAYYRRTEDMLANLFRDEATVPTVERRFRGFHDYLDGAREILMAGRGLRGRRAGDVRAAIGHALAFSSWRSLTREEGLDDAQAAELMRRLVVAAASRG